MKIVFLTRSFNYGGAERQLMVLAKALKRQGRDISVAVYYPSGPLQKEFESVGIPVVSLKKSGRWDVLAFLLRLTKIIWKQQPDILHSYLGTPNIITVLLKPLFPKTKIVWGVRASNMDLNQYDWLFKVSYWIESHLARFADLIIVNSNTGKAYAVKNGFPDEKIEVIHNGIDTDYFQPNIEAGAKVRAEWGVKKKEKLIGIVGRLDPMKDHKTFLRAAAELALVRDDVRFVCVGDGPPKYRHELHRLAEGLDLSNRLIWAGSRDDMPSVYNALDIASSSSSYGEGFPNVIGEAMSCGVPCVVTDVGDSALIVGQTGVVVPPKNPEAFVESWSKLLSLSQSMKYELGLKARERISQKFSRQILVDHTMKALVGLIEGF
jgi:glycosyltransferase involved in cell wall biosynthesis